MSQQDAFLRIDPVEILSTEPAGVAVAYRVGTILLGVVAFAAGDWRLRAEQVGW